MHSVTRSRQYLRQVSERLKNVHVESGDFLRVLSSYDAVETFFYLDPPYRGTRGGNSNYDLLSDEEWLVLYDALKKIKGKFLLSHNDDAFVVNLFKKFHLSEIDVRVTLPNIKNAPPRREVLISNYPLPEQAKAQLRQRIRRARWSPEAKAVCNATPILRAKGNGVKRGAL